MPSCTPFDHHFERRRDIANGHMASARSWFAVCFSAHPRAMMPVFTFENGTGWPLPGNDDPSRAGERGELIAGRHSAETSAMTWAHVLAFLVVLVVIRSAIVMEKKRRDGDDA